MNFFAHQDRARRQSRLLLLLFVLAVIVIIAAVNLVVFFFFGIDQVNHQGLGWHLLRENAGRFIVISLVVLGLIALASLFRIVLLSQGGGRVAKMLGGTPVAPDTGDPLKRRLLNVVEEIALASGVPAPDVYVLEQEQGINAFAAGHGPGDAVMAVTRGALERLNRSELQGVVAHEFSHILNGDMRLNIRLMGVLFGILVITIFGRMILRSAAFRRTGRDRHSNANLLVGLSLVIIGYLGVFLARLIKAAVSRQREYLADASAVQFTRDPQGISGALKKIGAFAEGSTVESPETEEVSHMLFAPGFASLSRLLATHPPLTERIRAIESHFDPEEFSRIAQRWAREEQAERQHREAAREVEQGRSVLQLPGMESLPGTEALPTAVVAGSVLADLNQPSLAQLGQAARLIETLPTELYQAAHSEQLAPLAVLFLLLTEDDEIRKQQYAVIEDMLGPAAVKRLRDWRETGHRLQPVQRLPLLELSWPALRHLPRRQLEDLYKIIERLVHIDRRISVFEYALGKLFESHLRDVLDPGGTQTGGRSKLTDCRLALQALFSVLARIGSDSEDQARRAYYAGMNRLLPIEGPDYVPPDDWPQALDHALAQLDQLQVIIKEGVVGALVATISHDDQITVPEAELLRAVCATLHCPVPLI